MRSALLLLVAFAIVGCTSTPPPEFDFEPVATIDGEFDAVWAAVIEYFVVGDLPIATIEKASGLIVTGWMDAGDRTGIKIIEDRRFCDCGEPAYLTIRKWTRGKFSIFVSKGASGALDVRVTCIYEQRRSSAIVNCNSTGYLEGQLHEYIQAKVNGTGAPKTPSFKSSNESWLG